MAMILVQASIVAPAASKVYERERPPPEHRGRDAGSSKCQMAKGILDTADCALAPENRFMHQFIALSLQEFNLIKSDLVP